MPSLESKLTKVASAEEPLELKDELLDEELSLLALEELSLLALNEELLLSGLELAAALGELEAELELEELPKLAAPSALEDKLELKELVELAALLELELADGSELDKALLNEEMLELDDALELGLANELLEAELGFDELRAACPPLPQAAIAEQNSAKVNARLGKRVADGNVKGCIVCSQGRNGGVRKIWKWAEVR